MVVDESGILIRRPSHRILPAFASANVLGSTRLVYPWQNSTYSVVIGVILIINIFELVLLVSSNVRNSEFLFLMLSMVHTLLHVGS